MAYPAKTWQKVKTAYLSGNYTVEKIAQMWSISTQAIFGRIQREGWERGKLSRTIAERNIERLTEAGATPIAVAETLANALKADKSVIIRDNGALKKSESGEPQGFVEQVPDWQPRLKAVEIINSMTGAIPQPEQKETNSGNFIIHINVPRPEQQPVKIESEVV
jgi:hypothetical protein